MVTTLHLIRQWRLYKYISLPHGENYRRYINKFPKNDTVFQKQKNICNTKRYRQKLRSVLCAVAGSNLSVRILVNGVVIQGGVAICGWDDVVQRIQGWEDEPSYGQRKTQLTLLIDSLVRS
jgi:hypothetical protein